MSTTSPSVEMPIRTSTGLTDDAVPEFDPHTVSSIARGTSFHVTSR